MEAITILERCRRADGDIRRLEQRIRQRRDALYCISPSQADPNGGSRGHGEQDKIGRLLEDIDALETSLKARRQERSVEIAAACVLLDQLPELESEVLHRYYIKHEETPGIARRKTYQESYIRKIKSRAEKALAKLPPDQVAATLPGWYLRSRGKEGEA